MVADAHDASRVTGSWRRRSPAAPSTSHPPRAGERQWTDGSTVFVVADTSPREQVRAIAVQAALLGAGSLDPEVLGTLARRPALVPRYLAVEGHRVLATPDAFLPVSIRALVDETIVAPSTRRRRRSRLPEVGSRSPIHPNGSARSGRSACAQWRTTRRVRADRRPTFLVARRRTRCASSTTTRLTTTRRRYPTSSRVPSGAAARSGACSAGCSRASGRPRPVRREPTRRPTPRSRDARGRPAGVPSSANAAPADAEGRVQTRSATYPEWDVHRHQYRPDWCTVVEIAPKPDELAPFAPPNAHALRRALAAPGRCPRSSSPPAAGRRHRHRRRRRKRVSRHSRVPRPASRCTSTRSGRRRDLSVLDVARYLRIGGRAERDRRDRPRAAARRGGRADPALARPRRSGRAVCVSIARSRGGHRRTGEALRRRVRRRVFRRLGGLVPGAYTRVGAAIRHGAAVLERDGGTPRRLLVVVSDGFAYDHGYEGAYGEADARRALAEARRRGTACLCLSVGAGTDAAALRRVFGTAAHATIPRAGAAPDVVAAAVSIRVAILGSAASGAQRTATHARAPAYRQENRMTPGTRPYYVPVGNEEQVFRAAFRQGLSVLLKGPTGCGKTRFVEAMAYDLERPLITVACHDDLTTADLVGRYLLHGGETAWVDGPLTRAVRDGAICYLDEVVEARQDTTVVLHPLADHRRQLPIDRLGRHARRGARVLARRLLQPRVPERAQGPEGLDPPAHGRHRARLPPGRGRGEDRGARVECRPRRGRAARAARSGDSAARERGSPRSGVDAGARCRRAVGHGRARPAAAARPRSRVR